jgi:hypothetical protein
MDLGMWAFRKVELGTRRVTFISSFKLALEQGMPPEAAYHEATKMTKLLQNSYTGFDRPMYQRGMKSVAFVFHGFVQHMAFHSYGGYEAGLRRDMAAKGKKIKAWNSYTLKALIYFFALSGLEGLPGMENVLDMLDGFTRRHYGKSLRMFVREFAREELRLDPNLFMHGLAHDIGGFNVSQSVGVGKIIPGTSSLREGLSPQEQAFDFAMALLGPVGTIGSTALRLLFSPMDEWQKVARQAPGELGNVLTAYRWYVEGVRTSRGARVLFEPDPEDPTHFVRREVTGGEIAWKAAGFNLTDASVSAQMRFEQLETKLYYKDLRARLLAKLNQAEYMKDREGIADARKAIKEFNDEVIYKQLRILPESIELSRNNFKNAQRQQERLQPVENMYRDVYREISQSFLPPKKSAAR